MSHNIHKSNGKLKQGHFTVYIVFISLLLDLLAFTMILPLLPSLLDHYRANDSTGLYAWLLESIRRFQVFVGAPEKYSSVLFGGALGSMFSFLQFIASPIVGGVSDVLGRKSVMIACLVSVNTIVWLLCTVAHAPVKCRGYDQAIDSWCKALLIQRLQITLLLIDINWMGPWFV